MKNMIRVKHGKNLTDRYIMVAHGWDNISIRMIKLCGKLFALPLRLILQSILYDGVFQMIEKCCSIP